MISVPYTIKELYHQDHCYKNIRIHFPNGERTDICNDLIVKDSVSFTESLCSQKTLKFGLCESPIFECEVVGVGNIKGAKIEVSVEIECPFSASGVEWKADLQRHVYSIPYGTFVVDSCKRQADMQHRKIVAYGYININDYISRGYFTYGRSRNYATIAHFNNYEDAKNCQLRNYGGDYVFNPISRLCCKYPNLPIELFSKSPTTFTWVNYTPSSITIYPGVGIRKLGKSTTISNAGRNANLYYFSRKLLYTPQEIYDLLLPIVMEKIEALPDEYKAEYPVELAAETLYKYIFGGAYSYEYHINGQSHTMWKYDIAEYDGSIRTRGGGNTLTMEHSLVDFPYDMFFYPYNPTDDSSDDNAIQIIYTLNYQLEINAYQQDAVVVQIRDDDHSEYIVDVPSISMTEPRVKDTEGVYTGYRTNGSFNAESYQSYFNALAELNGIFIRLSRLGEFELINIKQKFGLLPDTDNYPGESVYPKGVTGGSIKTKDYQSCWYDDDYIKPFGAISCKYKNTNNVDCQLIYYLQGFDDSSDENTFQVYSLDDNEIIKSTKWTQAQIEAFCTVIANSIEGVSYMPVEFVGRGLPYVESGDTFEILTRSNDSITTIVLNHNITGEQTLKDSYKSV